VRHFWKGNISERSNQHLKCYAIKGLISKCVSIVVYAPAFLDTIVHLGLYIQFIYAIFQNVDGNIAIDK